MLKGGYFSICENVQGTESIIVSEHITATRDKALCLNCLKTSAHRGTANLADAKNAVRSIIFYRILQHRLIKRSRKGKRIPQHQRSPLQTGK